MAYVAGPGVEGDLKIAGAALAAASSAAAGGTGAMGTGHVVIAIPASGPAAKTAGPKNEECWTSCWNCLTVRNPAGWTVAQIALKVTAVMSFAFLDQWGIGFGCLAVNALIDGYIGYQGRKWSVLADLADTREKLTQTSVNLDEQLKKRQEIKKQFDAGMQKFKAQSEANQKKKAGNLADIARLEEEIKGAAGVLQQAAASTDPRKAEVNRLIEENVAIAEVERKMTADLHELMNNHHKEMEELFQQISAIYNALQKDRLELIQKVNDLSAQLAARAKKDDDTATDIQTLIAEKQALSAQVAGHAKEMAALREEMRTFQQSPAMRELTAATAAGAASPTENRPGSAPPSASSGKQIFAFQISRG